MTAPPHASGGPLTGYRVLDLADDKGSMCGKMFADMGADVIKVEPPEGCPTRRIPPFLDSLPGPDRGLYFQAYAAGKRSVTLDLEQELGRRIFLDLAATADFLVESFPLGHLDDLGVGHEVLAERNPRLVQASITCYGDRGRGATWKAADINVWAAGGAMYLMGDPGRQPVQVSVPQAGLHAGGEAAVASMLAHLERERTGRGQRIVIDMQACVAWTLLAESSYPMLHGDFLRRSGVMQGAGQAARKAVHACADGYVTVLISGGAYSSTGVTLVQWMDDEGVAPDWLKAIDLSQWTPERFMEDDLDDLVDEVRRVEDVIDAFLAGKTMQEVYDFALEHRLLMAPVSTVETIADDAQLAARDYFQRVHQPTLGRDLTMVGPFVKMSATPLTAHGPAPSLGQHNAEILGELDFGPDELQYLYAQRVI